MSLFEDITPSVVVSLLSLEVVEIVPSWRQEPAPPDDLGCAASVPFAAGERFVMCRTDPATGEQAVHARIGRRRSWKLAWREERGDDLGDSVAVE